MMFKKLVIAVGAAMTLAYALPGSAAPVLDQSFNAFTTPSDTVAVIAAGGAEQGQSFSVGITGLLSRIDLQLQRTNFPTQTTEIFFDILPLSSDGFVRTTVVATGSIELSSLPTAGPFTGEYTSIDLSSFNIFVDAGDMLAIVIRDLNIFGSFAWLLSLEDQYAGGDRLSGNFFQERYASDGTSDTGFRTFVDPDAIVAQVPEPGTFLLLGLGLVGIGFARRRMAG